MISPLQPLAATWILALLCPLAFAAETGSRDGRDSASFKPYLGVGAAGISPENIYDAGAIEDGPQGRVAAGIRFNSAFRLQLEYSLTRDLEYSGNTN